MRDWILRVFFGLRKSYIILPTSGSMTITGPTRIEGYNIVWRGL